MIVAKNDPDYDKHLKQWQRCDEVLDGGDAVKAKREDYLPRLPGQTDPEYAAYLLRAVFYAAAKKTLDLFTGLVFSKSPKIEGLDADDPLLTDADLAGMPFAEVLEDVLDEVLGMGRYGVLVDWAGAVLPGMSKLDAEGSGARPFIAMYEACDILNWATASIANRRQLVEIVLQECYMDGDDEKKQRRDLFLDADGYHSDVYREVKDKDGKLVWTLVPELSSTPMKGNAPLKAIPFYFFDPEYGTYEIADPPLLDLVDANLSHYRTAADLEHALYHCGLPTPWATGISEPEKFSFSLGGTNGLISSSENAKFGYLEYSGKGVDPLETSLKRKEDWMAKLGSSLLADDKLSAETAQTATIKRTGEAATLASIANAVSAVATKVLKFLVEWSGRDASAVSVQLNTEYMPAGIDAQTITALVGAMQGGYFRQRDFLELLKVGGKLAPDADIDAIDAELGKAAADTLAQGLEMAIIQADAAAQAQAAAPKAPGEPAPVPKPGEPPIPPPKAGVAA